MRDIGQVHLDNTQIGLYKSYQEAAKDDPGSAMAGYMRSVIMISGMDLVYGEIIDRNHYEIDCVVEIE